MDRCCCRNTVAATRADWFSEANGHLYYYASEDALKDFGVQNGRVSSVPLHRSLQKSPFTGSTPTVSAMGNTGGVVWIVETRAWDRGGTPAVLRAYDALNVQRQLYSSAANPTRDGAGEAVRFAIPTVANGRVYFGVKKAVEVYGLVRAHSRDGVRTRGSQ